MTSRRAYAGTRQSAPNGAKKKAGHMAEGNGDEAALGDRRRGRPTMTDVARIAGVSQSSVSLVLNEMTGVAHLGRDAEPRHRCGAADRLRAAGDPPRGAAAPPSAIPSPIWSTRSRPARIRWSISTARATSPSSRIFWSRPMSRGRTRNWRRRRSPRSSATSR